MMLQKYLKLIVIFKLISSELSKKYISLINGLKELILYWIIKK